MKQSFGQQKYVRILSLSFHKIKNKQMFINDMFLIVCLPYQQQHKIATDFEQEFSYSKSGMRGTEKVVTN